MESLKNLAQLATGSGVCYWVDVVHIGCLWGLGLLGSEIGDRDGTILGVFNGCR